LGNTGKSRYGSIEIAKHALNFSVAHFTIFSKSERENIHGHNFQVACELTAPVDDNGLIFDYNIVKSVIRSICDEINEHVVLPQKSPYLKIEYEADHTIALFNDERIPFLNRDAMVLPIANTTVEEFSNYFLQRILHHPDLKDRGITMMTLKVSSSPGQTGCSSWEK
tara:strand:- start:2750 stop:3250 length:501 start_codon:yes stop_codon:yes gene_type:complete